MTPNAEATLERKLAEKARLLQQLREQADQLETEIDTENRRLMTARSSRGSHTARLRMEATRNEAWTPRQLTGCTENMSSFSRATTARASTAASERLVPEKTVAGESCTLADRLDTALPTRPQTSSQARPASQLGGRIATGASGGRPGTSSSVERPGTSLTGSDFLPPRLARATMGAWVRLGQMHDFTRDNRKKIQAMFVEADPKGDLVLTWQQLHAAYLDAGFVVSETQFQKMLEAMGEDWGQPINYADFFSHLTTLTFEMPEIFEVQSSIQFALTHMLRILQRRMTDRYSLVVKQLKIEDTEGNGQLSRLQLLRVIRATGLQFSEAQLDELLQNIDLNPLKTLDAHRFVKIFVPHHPIPAKVHDATTSIRAPNAPKDLNTAPLMSLAQLKSALQEKLAIAFSSYNDPVKEMFTQMDIKKEGVLTKKDFARAFQSFGIFPTSTQIEEFFKELDVERKGKINYSEFLTRMAPKPFDPHAISGAVRGLDAYDLARSKVRVQTASAQRPATATAVQMYQAVQKTLNSNAQRQRAETAFRAIDVGLSGKLSKDQMMQVLRKFDVYMTMHQFEDMIFNALKLQKGTHIDYMQFLDLFAAKAAGEAAPHPKKIYEETEQKPKGLNMMQAKALSARLSLDRVSKAPKGPVQAVNAAILRKSTEREAHRRIVYPETRGKDGNRIMPSASMPTPLLGPAHRFTTPLATSGPGPKSRVETPRGSGEWSWQKKAFELIKELLARQWEAFQAAFVALQDEDPDFKVHKKGLASLLARFSISLSQDEFDMLWRRLIPNANWTKGVNYFDLIRVFGPNLKPDRPVRSRKPTFESTGLKACAVNSAKPFEGHIAGSFNQPFSDNYDHDTGNHTGKFFGSKQHLVLRHDPVNPDLRST